MIRNAPGNVFSAPISSGESLKVIDIVVIVKPPHIQQTRSMSKWGGVRA